MSTIAFLVIGAMLITGVGLFIYEEVRIRLAQKKWEKKLEAAAAAARQQEANNESKEQMETGSATADFNASINILQDLNRNDKK